MKQNKLKFLLFFSSFVLISFDSNSTEIDYNPASEVIISFNKTADSIISLLTIEQKATQMLSTSIAIPEHGIEMYNWWNEALHGVARSAKATVFPQAIAMGATFDNMIGSYNEKGVKEIEPGNFKIFVGGSSPGDRSKELGKMIKEVSFTVR